LITRLARNTALACAVLTAGAAVWSRDLRVAGGVVAGGVLAALSLWALGGVVNALAGGVERGEMRRVSRGFALVKFFTRHVILAFVAYVMMVRLHLDPVGMVVGVTSVVVAAIVEATHPR
jgi:hypothetical protein